MAGQTQWHAMRSDAVLSALASTRQGLSQSEVESRLLTYGPNRLPVAKPLPAWLRFFRQFHNVLIYVLLGATLFRLSLNVASTRLILLDGKAGSVIQAFGSSVVGGSSCTRSSRSLYRCV